MTAPTLRTAHLILRPWRDSDRAPFAAMSADPQVMRHFPAPLDRAGSDAWIDRTTRHMDAHGFGFWAVEVPGIAPFIGAVGLLRVTMDVPFAPAIEIGWRLARPFWGRGLATEAAAASLDHGFGVLDCAEIVAFTVPANLPSQAVMRRLGMTRDRGGDFLHPNLPQGHPLRPHVLYRIGNGAWRTGSCRPAQPNRSTGKVPP